VYQRLYSIRGARKGRDFIIRQAQQINRTLDEWELQHKHILSPTTTMTAQEAFCLTELRFTLCTLRVLTQGLNRASNDRCSRLEYARVGLRLLQETCDTRGDSDIRLALYQRYAFLVKDGYRGLMSLSICLNYSATLFLELFIAIMEENQQDHRIDAELLSTFAEHMNFTSKLPPTSHSSKAAFMTSLCSNIALSIQVLDDGYLTRQTPPSRTSSTPDSPGLTTISTTSTFWPELVEGSSSSVGVPTAFIGEPSWELSSFPTDGNPNMKLHEGPASSYEQHRLLVGSTPPAEFAYRPDLAGVGSMEFDAILDTFTSYDHGGGLTHNDRF
jgi:hypothetical protein